MAFFVPSSTSQFLYPPPAPSRRKSQLTARDEVDEFLSSDLEVSFASTVSLYSPPRDPISFTPDHEYAEPMDISPAPAPPALSKLPSERSLAGPDLKQHARPRAFTSAARLFGNDISNELLPSPSLVQEVKPAGSVQSKKTQRSALPTEWLKLAHIPPQSAPPREFSSDDAMDIDTSFIAEPRTEYSFPVLPHSAAPTVAGFNNLFYDTMSPRRSFNSPASPVPKKRRSLSPVSPEAPRVFKHQNSSSPMLPSPSQDKTEWGEGEPLLSRLNKPSLQGLGAPSSMLKRPRRPALSAVVRPSEPQPSYSAHPVLATTGLRGEDNSPKGSPPARRAFSALIPPSGLLDSYSDESSFDGPDMSSPAQAYAKRQQIKTIRRCDGTDDFRPLTGATAMKMNESPSSRFVAAGMPGFGDNEAHGKILACHRVTEDGLMRISCQTLDSLLDGKYDKRIANFHIIDCRFDYEYAGGHIPGAININTTAGVEELLLSPSSIEVKPSVSGDSVKKTILVFHCEFSAKRAPTFAKHLRAKDRAMNNHVYPKIHFPEVYILEGGYCQYFKVSPNRCEPPAYVTMDDPVHAASRREDLDQFRKARFGRHKSYAYGDGKTFLHSMSQQQQKRNTAPSGGPNSLFAAANAARTRRGGGRSLMTLAEDGNTTADPEDTDTDIGDSPCPPPPTKASAHKSKKSGRASLVRAETYNPARMAY